LPRPLRGLATTPGYGACRGDRETAEKSRISLRCIQATLADLRKLLYFPAMSAIRHNPLLKAFAERLRQNGKPPKLILAAAMRKLLHIAFGVLRSNAPFNPNILAKNI
jgi:transposase